MCDLPVSPEGQAYHEAGHVVFGIRMGKALRSVKIRQGESQANGCTEWELDLPKDGPLILGQIKPTCFTLLAGHETQLEFQPDSLTCYSSHFNDLAQATKLFDRVDKTAERTHKDVWVKEIRKTLKQYDVRSAISAIADRLLKSTSVSGEEATNLAREHL
jgi:hypothetical protein